MNKLYTIHSSPGIQLRATLVPGGLLIITDSYEESGNGIAVGLATTFVPMSEDERYSFLQGRE